MVMRKRWVLGVVALLMLAGCQQMTPKKTWAAAEETYIATATSLVTLHDSGQIDTENWKSVQAYDTVAFAALEAWWVALETGQPTAQAIADFHAALAQMEGFKSKEVTK